MRLDVCSNCKHWHGAKHSEYGDCEWVTHTQLPLHKEEDRFGNACRPPLDPHDVLTYYWPLSLVRVATKRLKGKVPWIKVETIKEDCYSVDNTGELKCGKHNISYVRTHREGNCTFYDS